MTRLQDRVALVTGAGRGIGKAIALGYAGAGADLVLVSRSAGELAAVAAEVARLGRRALPVVADVRDQPAVQQAAGAAQAEFGRVDILVNAAGIPMVAPSEELALADWQRTIDINLTGTFLCCQAVGRLMLAQGRGAIINIGSLQSFQGFPFRVAYAASKGGVIALAKNAARVLAAQGIRVNTVSPGATDTPMIAAPLADAAHRARIEGLAVQRRIGQPQEIATGIVYLLSAGASFTHGANLVIDGGIVL